MVTKEYEELVRLTWSVLLNAKIRAVPVDTERIIKRHGITLVYADELVQAPPLHKYQHNGERAEQLAYSFYKNGAPCILQKRGLEPNLARYAQAHEIGHILLGHISRDTSQQNTRNLDYYRREDEANKFAYHLLVPLFLLRDMEVASIKQIGFSFGVPPAVAYGCLHELRNHYLAPSGLFVEGFSSPLEEKLYHQMVPKGKRKY